MKQKNYDGYRSFQYLDEDDYVQFELAPQLHRVPVYSFDLTGSQEERVQRLLEGNIVISTHEHTSILPDDISELPEYEHQGRERTGFEGLAVSGMDAVFENFMDGTCTITSKAGWKWDDVIYDIGMRLSDIAHQDMLFRGESVRDIEYAAETGRIAFIPALESSTPIENEVDRIDILYGLGLRMLGICYSEGNSLGSGQREPGDGGLTLFGREAVARMNKLGMAIDVSHASDRTCLDTIKYSKAPVFLSHTGARALWKTPGMKPDEILKGIAGSGGVMGIIAAPNTSRVKDMPEHNIEAVMKHFEYCVDLVGIDHVGFGPDTLFGDHAGLHVSYSKQMSIKELRKDTNVEDSPYVAGLENPSECFPNIVRWLVKHNYSDEDISKVIGKNMLDALKNVWVR